MILLQSLVTQMLRAQNNAAGEETIMKNREHSNDAFRKHDLDGIGKFLAKDVTVITASGQVLVGKDAVLGELKKRFNAAAADLTYGRYPEHVVIAGSDTLAWERGTWLATLGRHPLGEGNYAATWCRREGKWLIRSELFVALK
jgi:ketosteroid isomerase-like protein